MEAGFIVGVSKKHGDVDEIARGVPGIVVGEDGNVVDCGPECCGAESAGTERDGGEDLGCGFCAHAGEECVGV